MRTWQEVLELIESRLLSGELTAGDRLPSERALSAEFGVGRSSVREAIRVLEAMGLVHTASGSGPNSGAVIVATPDSGMRTLMRLQSAARHFPVADLVETRLLIEGTVVSRLAEAHESEVSDLPALETAEKLLDAMDRATTAEEFLALDASFHLALAEAAGNTVILAVMAGLRSGIESYVVEGVHRLPDWQATAERLRREHRGILEAIYHADAQTAHSRMQDHIEMYYAATVGVDSQPHEPMPSRHVRN